jgi:hypothetical protein
MDCPVDLIQKKRVNKRAKRVISNGMINLLLIMLQKRIKHIIKGMEER